MERDLMRRRRRESSAKRGADWSSIPGDILSKISQKIESIEDFVTLCVVCRYWYFIAPDLYRLNHKKFEYASPYCMLRLTSEYDSHSDYNSDDSKFSFCTYDPKIRKKKIVLDLPEAAGRQCWGSPFGWLVTFCPNDLQFSLLNPFSKATLSLPNIANLTINDGPSDGHDIRYTPSKAFLMANPDHSPENCFVFVVVIVNGEFVLAYAKPGVSVWSRIQGPNDLSDIICFKGSLYGVRTDIIYTQGRRRNRNRDPVLFLIQLQPYPHAVELPITGDRSLSKSFSGSDLSYSRTYIAITKRYLVDLNGELCLVIRYKEVSTRSFLHRIFKIDLTTRTWTRVTSLGDQCLFVGNNYSFACKGTSPMFMANPYPPRVHDGDSFVCGYLFYTDDNNDAFVAQYGRPVPVPNGRLISLPDVGVYPFWPVRSQISYCFPRDALRMMTSYPQLWIVPALSFRRLGEIYGPRRCMERQ